MTSRKYDALATQSTRDALESLTRKEGTAAYRESLTTVGRALGGVVADLLGRSRKPFALVTTPEDADFLASGALESLPKARARLVCYWTQRRSFDDGDVATVIQRYEDPRVSEVATVVVLKSIIATSCIVRTNLEQLLLRVEPTRIIVAAPVMLSGAEKRLRASFPKEIADRIEVFAFATDDTMEGSVVKPGIGGMVVQRLGLSSRRPRAKPSLVATWQSTQAS